jgi:hypothetical protein
VLKLFNPLLSFETRPELVSLRTMGGQKSVKNDDLDGDLKADESFLIIAILSQVWV